MRNKVLMVWIIGLTLSSASGAFVFPQRSLASRPDTAWLSSIHTIIANNRGFTSASIGPPDVTRPGWFSGRYGTWEQDIQAAKGSANAWWDDAGTNGYRRFCYLGECGLDEVLLFNYSGASTPFLIGFNYATLTNALATRSGFRTDARWISTREWYNNPAWSGYVSPQSLKLPVPVNPDGSLVSYETFNSSLAARTVEGLSGESLVTSPDVTDAQAALLGIDQVSFKQNGCWVIEKDSNRMDFGNPQVLNLMTADIRSMVQRLSVRTNGTLPGIDGVHIDGLNNSLTLYSPDIRCFGLWTEHNFCTWLQSHFTPLELAAMGVTNASEFSISGYIRAAGSYTAAAWNTNQLWQCYKIAFLEQRTAMMASLRQNINRIAAEYSPRLAVSGNLIPTWPGAALYKGLLDVPYFEWSADNGFGLSTNNLPFQGGRYGYIGKLAAAVSETGYAWASVFVSQAQYKGRPELHKLVAYNCLINRLIPDWNYTMLYGRTSLGTTNSFRSITRFIQQAENLGFLAGTNQADIGVVFDPWSEVASVTVGSRYVEPFTLEYSGWCDYLEDHDLQWDVLLCNSNLTANALNRYRVVILPSYSTISTQSVEAIKTYVQGGGHVIATGGTGTRFPPDGLLMPRSTSAFSGFSHSGFQATTNTPGSLYRTVSKNLTAANQLQALLAAAGITSAPVATVPSLNAGITVAQTEVDDKPVLLVHMVNRGYNLSADAVISAPPAELSVQLPQDMAGFTTYDVHCIQAGDDTTLNPVQLSTDRIIREGNLLRVQMDPFLYYQILLITGVVN